MLTKIKELEEIQVVKLESLKIFLKLLNHNKNKLGKRDQYLSKFVSDTN